MIDDETAHDARGVSHEAGLIGKGLAFARGDVEIGFVKQRGDAQAGGSGSAPTRQLTFGQPVQLGVEGGEEGIRRGAIAALGCSDEGGNCGTHAGLLRANGAAMALSVAQLAVATKALSSSD